MDEYGHLASFATRWNDNDVYGHVNNAVYYEAMDTTINTWLIEHGGLDLVDGPSIGVCKASSCEYTASGSYPDVLVVGLRAGRLGSTSLTWETGIFRERDGELLATGRFVHVFVDRAHRRPVPIPAALRAAVEARLVA
ncbi:acyl-CoA thioesterase [Cellulomonas chengniuliangii]|uniref:Acyl-CoA thioesterase n=1 Tax=Cellulomonas chengniuliangii TaxID=2968084 RepID=A0ABY5L432_9CELL|nr:thioesterase family protein [Cellulomonas chengniuliangii]MCC2309821.1 acyl-CoA thioesterase [Cellulomonas chengniuliangii]MCC2318079.1 acyl-CoA thioesterase [Cellulomonas chengniuliangii]UUI76266.1 acyl-CoA thioesterase [Cellulomonas chengniuliangii]